MDIQFGADAQIATNKKEKGGFMKFLIGLLVLGVTVIGYTQTLQQPFTITISIEKPQVRVGDPVELNVIMTNTSDHNIACDFYWYDSLDRNYKYEVVYEDGKPASKIVRKTPFNTDPCIIPPGESKSSGGEISRAFDFSRPGKYTIQVSRSIWGDDQRRETIGIVQNKQPEVKSNIITVIVLPADEPPPAKQ
jgi:hypothetical protein